MVISPLGPISLSLWHCCVTLFDGFYNPLPADELEAATFAVLVNFVAPECGPIFGADKAALPFYVPCLLKVAPLTANMAKLTGRASGKQRSSAHVTVARFLVIDVDGLSPSEFDALLGRLRGVGLTYLVYSTHSHGREDKPGVRGRLVVPVDRALDAGEYAKAWLGFDQIFCYGAIAAADDSGRHLHQQQGVWVVHPDRAKSAFRAIHKAGVASADTLIVAAPEVIKSTPQQTSLAPIPRSVVLPTNDLVDHLGQAIAFIDPDGMATWMRIIMALKALAPVVGADIACEFTLRYSERGSNTEKNAQRKYNPAEVFRNASPSMPPDAALGVIYGEAKSGAVRAVNACLGLPTWTPEGKAAAEYLARFHRRTWSEMTGKEVA